MPRLKGNLHTHTTLSDGTLSPEETVRRYRQAGYDFVAITDHRCLIGEGEDATREYLGKLPASDDGMIVLAGIEEEPLAIGKRHVGVIRSPKEELRIINHPSEYGLSVEDVVESVRLVGAHSVEITCHGRHLEAYDVTQLGVPRIATDDAHFGHEIGVSWIEVEAERDADSIVRAIKRGAFVRYIRGLLADPWSGPSA
jgi:predicted metal-dependent phosphoesterase TrpH